MTSLRSTAPVVLFAVAYAAVALVVRDSYYQLIMTLVLVWAGFGLSWNVLSGYTGLVSFGHAAFFGLGAYTTALGQTAFDLSPWFLMPAAAVVGGAAGLVIGLPTFRLRSHYFAIAMLAYPLSLLSVFEWLGYQEVTVPLKREGAAAYTQFADNRAYTLIGLALLVAIALITTAVERSRFGMALRAIKENESAAEAAGIDTLRWKLRSISLSGAMAAAVGAFYAVVLLVVTPVSVFGMLVSAQALTVTMFGGIGTVWGPIIGSVLLVPTSELLHAHLGDRFPGIQGVIFGAAIVVVILVAPEGIFWKVQDVLGARRRSTRPPAVPTPSARASSGPGVTDTPIIPSPIAPPSSGRAILEVRGLSRRFGGLKAVDNVSFDIPTGSILGIIGPNGAGKTTMFNLLNGLLKPDAGAVLLDGRNQVGRSPHELCRAGVGRTFQIMRPFMRMSVADNVLVGAYVHSRGDREARSAARSAIARVGLSDVASRAAGELTTKELRLMELARALAGGPRLLLLDEPLAGLARAEGDQLVAIVRQLAESGITVAIIEHTMHVMVRLATRFLVLDHGAVLAEGPPDAITRDQRVIEAYLGRRWSRHASGQ